MWINNLKIAIVEQNTKLLEELLSDIPHFEKKEDIEQVKYLLQEASSMMHILREDAATTMKQIKKNLDFLRSNDIITSKNLDIKL